jgi:hypothetical protein
LRTALAAFCRWKQVVSPVRIDKLCQLMIAPGCIDCGQGAAARVKAGPAVRDRRPGRIGQLPLSAHRVDRRQGNCQCMGPETWKNLND